MATKYDALLKQINSKQGIPDPNAVPAEPKPKKAYKPRQSSKAPSTKTTAASQPVADAGPSGSQSSLDVSASQDGKKAASKIKFKGSVHGFTPVAKPHQSSEPQQKPLASRIKGAIDFLREHAQSVSYQQLFEQTNHDLTKDQELLGQLRGHERVRMDMDGYIRYKPRHEGITTKEELLNFIRDSKQGVYVSEINDSYRGVTADIEALKRDKKIYVIANPDVEKDAAFAQEDLNVEVEDDVVQHYIQQQVPTDILELQETVLKAGLRSALANQPEKRVLQGGSYKQKQKKPRQQRINIDKATNAHLPFLFQGAQPKNIDEK